MIQKIEESDFPQYHRELAEAARDFLPCLAFSSEEIEHFIRYNAWRKMKTNIAYQYQNPAGQKLFIGGPRRIEYILPSNWPDRYTLIKEGIQAFMTKLCAEDPDAKIRFAIDETVPSHGAYFIGLLPDLGFDLVPRIEMKSDHTIIDNLSLPTLPNGFEELPYLEKHFDLFADAYTKITNAIHTKPKAQSSYEREQQSNTLQPFEDYYCYKESTQELREKVWVGMLHQNRIVGYCLSDIWENGKRMIVLELAVDPEFWGRGLGRYLTLRNMQKMKEHYGTPESFFTIGTQRDNVRARTLYESLGLKRWQVHTRVFYPKQ